MKKLICASLALLLLWGCAARPAGTTGQTTGAVQSSTTQTPVTVDTTTAASTTPQTTGPETKEGYLQQVVSHDQPVYSSPTYDGTVVATVGQAGVYTIMEEVTDSEGNLWGRLKSGLGWIDLNDVRRTVAEPPLLTAACSEWTKLPESSHEYPGQDGEYTVGVVFHAYERLTDVRLYSGWWDGAWTDPQLLYELDALDPEKPLVAQLAFPGDLSMYAISFTDAAGSAHTLYLRQNGRNNALSLSED